MCRAPDHAAVPAFAELWKQALSLLPLHTYDKGYFCPSPRKVPNADFRLALLTKHAFCSKYPRRSAVERRISARFSTDPTGEMSKVTERRLMEKR
jgi:hypothetical protein